MSRLSRLFDSSAPRAVALVRLSVGSIFLSEGAQKFLFADALGAGRFAKIGIPVPSFTGPFVGTVEIVCGLLVLAGLATRVAASILVINMAVALLSTKIPILLGHGLLGFAPPKGPQVGLWAMLHEARTDWAMILASSFLAIVGAGPWSLDERLSTKGQARRP